MLRYVKRQIKWVLKLGYFTLLKVLPENRVGDKIFGFISFVFHHKRLPTKALLFNDVYYQIKTSNTILDPLRVFISDKEYLKRYIKNRVGDEYNVPTISILKTNEEVDHYHFPASCCIKPTHGSGKVILRKNNEPIDREEIKKWFSINYYKQGREANYRYLQPKVMVEELVFGTTNASDFKIFCYRGKAKLIQIDIDRRGHHTRKFFDRNWIEQDFSLLYEKNNQPYEIPKNAQQMLELCEQLAADFSFIRIDLYSNGEKIFVGEITNCHGNAGQTFIPVKAEKIASELIFT